VRPAALRVAMLAAGAAVAVAALSPPVDAWADERLSAHMAQHLALALAAAPLLVAGAPISLALRALPRDGARALARLLRSRAARVLTHPLVTWTLFAATMIATHLTGLYAATLRHPALHAAEHVAYLVTAFLFWLPVLGNEPLPHRLGWTGRMLYLLTAMPAMGFAGVVLATDERVRYAAYLAPARRLGISALADQHLAGTMMWVGGSAIAAVLTLVAAWTALVQEERREVAREGRRDAASAGRGAGALAGRVPLWARTAGPGRGGVAQSRRQAPPRPGRRRLLAFVAVACAAGCVWELAAAAGAGRGATPPAGAAAAGALVARGRVLFGAGCSSCHGFHGEGVAGMGPSLHGAGALAADFYLSTGRMPLNNPADPPVRSHPSYTRAEIAAIVAYVGATFGGPPIPAVDPAAGTLAAGRKAFTDHCAGCHQVMARGGLVTGGIAPPLLQATPRQVAEAVRLGPYLMPRFGPRQVDQRTLDSIARYVAWTQRPDDRGGWALGNIGPIPEGMVAWLLGLVALLIGIRLIGERTAT